MEIKIRDTYCKYPRQHKPQDAYIEISKDKIVAEANPEVVEAWINANMGTLETIADGIEVEWNGSNYVGKLTAEAQAIFDEFFPLGNCESLTDLHEDDCIEIEEDDDEN